ncbi:uncharacterized protein LOC131619598 [Vicia villosa]|uniref:uncharacterized protein LOC131619598 n=1 Tax=Vicia villosa TaxID=3911 RepID=UPI00273A835F|nr:uncharacterized protein LOC131619598 [Vicia villosa]
MVMQQERKINGTLFASNNVVEDGTGMINIVDGTKQSIGRGRGNGNFSAGRGRGNLKVCAYCGKTGHIIDNCYKKHGYPPSFGRGNSYVNQVEVDDSEKCAATSTSDNGSMSLTREQYQNLMMLLEKNTGSINITKGDKSYFANFNARSSAKKGLKKIGLAKELDGLYHLEDSERDSNIAIYLLVYIRHVYQQARHKCLSFSTSNNNAYEVFVLIHINIWGPFNTTSVHGFKYFLTILDDHSRHVWVVMLKSKAEVGQRIKDFVEMIETQFPKKVKIIRSDNGTELLMPVYYASKVLHVVFVMNRIPTKVLKNKSSYEVMNGVIPDLSLLRVFIEVVP